MSTELIEELARMYHAEHRTEKPTERDWISLSRRIGRMPTTEEADAFEATWDEQHRAWEHLRHTRILKTTELQ